MDKPTITDQINYIKDLRDSIDGGTAIHILALPVERIMLDEIVKSLQKNLPDDAITIIKNTEVRHG
jgi:hypothetical protein